ncbi:hypothetical protein AB0I72_26955 [Nocardiopsis sp. NPDC049922]|uniref:hypothetical protein n=1 Tax=Nocardiopsis sp. NPDC049922 TaxID=3155157 RepID=UPI0033CC9EC9
MSRPCPEPSMTVRVGLPDLMWRIAHGARHMPPADLAFRTVLALGALVVAAWMIHRGEVGWPLVVGVVGALSVAVDAVELYAVATVCDHLTEPESDR